MYGLTEVAIWRLIRLIKLWLLHINDVIQMKVLFDKFQKWPNIGGKERVAPIT